jgi:hypothetical protein
VIRPHFASDERNTDRSVSVVVKTGGARAGQSRGAHWHASLGNEVRYLSTDSLHQTITWVGVTGPDGKTTEYFSSDYPISDAALARSEKRVMDCLDCHNRQGHNLLLPDQAIDEAIADGGIDRRLPYIRRVALELVTREYRTPHEARQGIADGITDFYRLRYPRLMSEQGGAIRRSIEAVQGVWTQNVFPEMNVTWGAYPDNIGHRNAPGCFRCHDGRHVSREGKTIRQECNLCHALPVPEVVTADDLADDAVGWADSPGGRAN